MFLITGKDNAEFIKKDYFNVAENISNGSF